RKTPKWIERGMTAPSGGRISAPGPGTGHGSGSGCRCGRVGSPEGSRGSDAGSLPESAHEPDMSGGPRCAKSRRGSAHCSLLQYRDHAFVLPRNGETERRDASGVRYVCSCARFQKDFGVTISLVVHRVVEGSVVSISRAVLLVDLRPQL